MNFLRNQPEVGQYVVTSVFVCLFVCLFVFVFVFFLHVDLLHGLAGR